MHLNTVRFQGLANEAERGQLKKRVANHFALSSDEIASIPKKNYLMVDYTQPDKFGVLKDNTRLLFNLLMNRPKEEKVVLSYEFKNSKHRKAGRNKLNHLEGGRLIKLLGYSIKNIRFQNVGAFKVISYVEIEKNK